MNVYQQMWGVLGYGRRRRSVLATAADIERKLAALNRIWRRMCVRHGISELPAGFDKNAKYE